MSEHTLKINKIHNGTVIDHVPGGMALHVLSILGIDGTGGETVSVAMNVPSERLDHKDIVKVEDRELSQTEVDVLSLIAPEATINIIRDYTVIEKHQLERPTEVHGVFACPNPNCITVGDEPVESSFAVVAEGVRCEYCGTLITEAFAEHLQ